MQSGKIGLRSMEGRGSTFAFYIKAKRAVLPSLTLMEEALSKKRSAGSSGMSLPSQPPKMRALDSVSPTAEDGQYRPSQRTPFEVPPKEDYHILLVEDNELNQKVLAKQLRKAGCTVAVANHGGEAVDYLLRMQDLPAEYGTPEMQLLMPSLDCILMDWEM